MMAVVIVILTLGAMEGTVCIEFICTEYVTDYVKSLCVHICLCFENYHFEIINQPCQTNWQCLIRRTIISFLLIDPYTTNLASQILADFGMF